MSCTHTASFQASIWSSKSATGNSCPQERQTTLPLCQRPFISAGAPQLIHRSSISISSCNEEHCEEFSFWHIASFHMGFTWQHVTIMQRKRINQAGEDKTSIDGQCRDPDLKHSHRRTLHRGQKKERYSILFPIKYLAIHYSSE